MKTKFIISNNEITDFDGFINSIYSKKDVSITGFVSFYIELPIDKRKILSNKLYKESFLNNVEIEKLSQSEIMKFFVTKMFFRKNKKVELSKVIKKADNSLYYKYLFISLDYIIFYLLCEKKINFFQDLEKFIELLNIRNILQIAKKITKEIYSNVDFEKNFSNFNRKKTLDKNRNIFEFIIFSFADDLCKRNNLELSPLSLEELITETIIVLYSKDISEALKTSIEDFFGKNKI